MQNEILRHILKMRFSYLSHFGRFLLSNKIANMNKEDFLQTIIVDIINSEIRC
jgi:hypothetical protein